MKDFNDNFDAMIGSIGQLRSVLIEPLKNIDAINTEKDVTEMNIDDGNGKNMTDKEREEIFLAKKRKRVEEEKKADWLNRNLIYLFNLNGIKRFHLFEF